MTQPITVYGASDDLIEIEGGIREEFTYSEEENGDLLAFSNGTVLRIRYVGGVWRITLVVRGGADTTIEQAPEDDEDNYSDRATVSGFMTPMAWVVQGVAIVQAKPRKHQSEAQS